MAHTLANGIRRVAVRLAPDPAPDGELLARYLVNQDEDAFAGLVHRHAAMVFGTCRRVLGNAADADDAFQAAFLVLVRRGHSLTDRVCVGNFLYGVAFHTALKAKAMAVKRRSKEERARPPEVDPERPGLLAALDEELARLPEKYREPVVMCELEGRSRRDAAAALGIPEGTISSRLATAHRLLAKRLRSRGFAGVPVATLLGTLSSAANAALEDAAVRAVLGPTPSVSQLALEVTKMLLIHKIGLGAGALVVLLAGLATASPTRLLSEQKATDGHELAPLAAHTGSNGLTEGVKAPGAGDARADRGPQQPKPAASGAPVPAKGWVTKHTFTCKSPVTAVAFGADFVVTGHHNGDVVLWDAKTGKEKDLLINGEKNDSRGIDQIQISRDAALLYLVTDERLFVNKCSIAKENRIFAGVGCGNKWFGVNPSGSLYLGTNEGRTALVIIKDPFDQDTRDQLVRTTHAHSDPIDLLAGVNDNAVVTVAGGVLRRWKTSSEEPVWEQKLDEKVQPTHLSVAAAGGIVAVADKGGDVHLFSADTGKLTAKLSGHVGAVRAVAFSPNGKQVVTGGDDKTARVWDAQSGKELAKFEGHTKAVTGVGFSSGGDMIVTGSADKTARVWEFNK